MIDEKQIRDWYATEVKERMEDAGIQPYEVAYYCRIRHESIYGYLQGRQFPKLWNMILLAECLDCSVNDLLGYDEIDDVDVYERLLASKTYRNEIDFAGHFSSRLFRMMYERNILPKELSERTGISLNLIKQWICENPITLPTVMNLIRIADALDCTPSDLLGY